MLNTNWCFVSNYSLRSVTALTAYSKNPENFLKCREKKAGLLPTKNNYKPRTGKSGLLSTENNYRMPMFLMCPILTF